MKYTRLLLGIGLVLGLGIQSLAAETSRGDATVNIGSARYGPGGHVWAEGVISNVGRDGRFTIRGTRSPYADNYITYNHDYNADPEHRRELDQRFRNRLDYTWNDSNVSNYSFVTPDYDSIVVYDEPNYGTDFNTWSYSGNPHTYRYDELRAGDRVAIGYDENGNKVERIYRIHPSMALRPRLPGVREVTPDNTRANNISEEDNTRPTENKPAVLVPER